MRMETLVATTPPSALVMRLWTSPFSLRSFRVSSGQMPHGKAGRLSLFWRRTAPPLTPLKVRPLEHHEMRLRLIQAEAKTLLHAHAHSCTDSLRPFWQVG